MGVESAHKSEQAVEFGVRRIQSAYNSHRLKPYRQLAKAEKQTVKAETNYLYHKRLRDDPLLASNPISRWQQKQAIKKEYIAARYGKSAKTAQKTAENTKTAFLQGICDMIESLVQAYEVIKGADVLFPSKVESIGICPRCGSNVAENKKGFCCSDKSCGFALWKENKFFTSKKKTLTKAVATELLKNGRIKLTGCYSEKTGKTYDALIILDDTGGKYVNFKMEFVKK
ncbi:MULTISPECIES: hypothetical protein [unclassified Lacrimispora]|uniref:hypothetical protein n=1 Tax=unclassified Lacrimispora TaxID=2719232 RepID=UPI0037705EC2